MVCAFGVFFCDGVIRVKYWNLERVEGYFFRV